MYSIHEISNVLNGYIRFKYTICPKYVRNPFERLFTDKFALTQRLQNRCVFERGFYTNGAFYLRCEKCCSSDANSASNRCRTFDNISTSCERNFKVTRRSVIFTRATPRKQVQNTTRKILFNAKKKRTNKRQANKQTPLRSAIGIPPENILRRFCRGGENRAATVNLRPQIETRPLRANV